MTHTMWEEMVQIAGGYHHISNGKEREDMINIYAKLHELRMKWSKT